MVLGMVMVVPFWMYCFAIECNRFLRPMAVEACRTRKILPLYFCLLERRGDGL
jgi:hypothetical protein